MIYRTGYTRFVIFYRCLFKICYKNCFDIYINIFFNIFLIVIFFVILYKSKKKKMFLNFYFKLFFCKFGLVKRKFFKQNMLLEIVNCFFWGYIFVFLYLGKCLKCFGRGKIFFQGYFKIVSLRWISSFWSKILFFYVFGIS